MDRYLKEQFRPSDFPGKDTKYGFEWGPATVERAASDPKYGVFILVTTPYRELQVWVTPSGRKINVYDKKRSRKKRAG